MDTTGERMCVHTPVKWIDPPAPVALILGTRGPQATRTTAQGVENLSTTGAPTHPNIKGGGGGGCPGQGPIRTSPEGAFTSFVLEPFGTYDMPFVTWLLASGDS